MLLLREHAHTGSQALATCTELRQRDYRLCIHVASNFTGGPDPPSVGHAHHGPSHAQSGLRDAVQFTEQYFHFHLLHQVIVVEKRKHLDQPRHAHALDPVAPEAVVGAQNRVGRPGRRAQGEEAAVVESVGDLVEEFQREVAEGVGLDFGGEGRGRLGRDDVPCCDGASLLTGDESPQLRRDCVVGRRVGIDGGGGGGPVEFRIGHQKLIAAPGPPELVMAVVSEAVREDQRVPAALLEAVESDPQGVPVETEEVSAGGLAARHVKAKEPQARRMDWEVEFGITSRALAINEESTNTGVPSLGVRLVGDLDPSVPDFLNISGGRNEGTIIRCAHAVRIVFFVREMRRRWTYKES